MVDKIHRQTKGFDLLIAVPSHSAESKDRHSLVRTQITREYVPSIARSKRFTNYVKFNFLFEKMNYLLVNLT